MFVVLTIAAASRHSKLNNPTASRYYDACTQRHSSAQRDCRSQHDRILRRVADLHPAAPGR
ncbi:MAG: hypothetical protein ACLP75_10740 [Mycobacterium sp.]|uniref:hypothetical protein n=1 Tax=Mycobacterium sp. TaxID=1785 RepID=UPI003F94C099